MRSRTPLTIVTVVSAFVLLVAVPTLGEVVFFVEGHGSSEDSGHADFHEAAGLPAEQDFEDPLLGQDFTVQESLPVGELDLQLDCSLFDGTPFPPFLFSSPEFDVEGRVHGRALVVGTSLTVTTPADQELRGFGTWIFDDGGVLDSAYFVQVTETDGSVWEVILENENPLNVYRHEIEGFIGVLSDVGISQITITSIDPVTGEAHPDGFEIDHVLAVGVVLPPDDEDDGDRCHRRRHGRRSHGHHCRHRGRGHGHHGSHGQGHSRHGCHDADNDANDEDQGDGHGRRGRGHHRRHRRNHD